MLDFNEDTNEVRCERVYAHPHEAWCLASCPAPEHSELPHLCTTGNERSGDSFSPFLGWSKAAWNIAQRQQVNLHPSTQPVDPPP